MTLNIIKVNLLRVEKRIKGKFIIGRRKSPPWFGYHVSDNSSDTDLDEDFQNMACSIIIDTGFWIALYNKRDRKAHLYRSCKKDR